MERNTDFFERTSVTASVIILCAALLVAANILGKIDISRYAVHGASIMKGEYWRLMTGAFFHGSVMHLLMNMIALYNIGSILEPGIGKARYVSLLALSIIGSSLAVCLLNPNMPTIGMSGGIFGLFGCSVTVMYRKGMFAMPGVKESILRVLLANLLISLLPGVSLWGHAGGLLTGLILGIAI